MNYKDFLLFMAEMRHYGRARLSIGSVEIFITSQGDDTWELKTPLSSLEEDLPFSTTFFQWKPRGSYLKANLDRSHLFLIQEITAVNKYIFLKNLMKDFVNTAIEWKEIFEYSPAARAN